MQGAGKPKAGLAYQAECYRRFSGPGSFEGCPGEGKRRFSFIIYLSIRKKRNGERRKKMAEKKLVEAITSMDEDFAQWYTDVVK